MTDYTQLIDNYLAGVNALRSAVRGLSREQLEARPVPGKWSTLEVVCHLSDFDPILADRMKRVIAEDRPPLLGADELRPCRLDKVDVMEQVTRSRVVRVVRLHEVLAGILADGFEQAIPLAFRFEHHQRFLDQRAQNIENVLRLKGIGAADALGRDEVESSDEDT